MKVLEKIERCVSLIWNFQEIYGEEDIEDFCSNELDTYPQYNEILDYFKRIANLEKENKVLAQNLEDTEILNKTYEKRFNDLEKENAELKLKLEALEGQTPWKDIKDKSEVIGQLTKAKEIINDCVCELQNILFYKMRNKERIASTLDKAEHFLSEVEK